MSFGNPAFLARAEAHGARGIRHSADNTRSSVHEEAFDIGGVMLVDSLIDYSVNSELDEMRAVSAHVLAGECGG